MILLLYYLVSSGYAKANVDPNRFGPIKEQGQTQFCHSAVAADLLDEYFGYTNGDGVSFLDIALHISVQNSETASFLEAHVIDRHPDQSQVMWTVDGKTHEFAETYPFGNRKNIYDRTNYVSWAIYSYTNLNSRGQCKESYLPSEDKNQSILFLKNMIDSFKEDALAKQSSPLKIESLNQLVAKKIRQNCRRSPIAPINPKSINLMGLSAEQKTRLLKQLLDQGIPAGLSFNFLAVHPDANFLHISTLIGYEIKNKKVIFKLRNSFGKKCRVDTFPVPKCKDGYLYIESTDLANHANYITWIPR